MDINEAKQWLRGDRSLRSEVAQFPFETLPARIAEADAAMTQQAYWIAKAHAEGIVEASKEHANEAPTGPEPLFDVDGGALGGDADAEIARAESRSILPERGTTGLFRAAIANAQRAIQEHGEPGIATLDACIASARAVGEAQAETLPDPNDDALTEGAELKPNQSCAWREGPDGIWTTQCGHSVIILKQDFESGLPERCFCCQKMPVLVWFREIASHATAAEFGLDRAEVPQGPGARWWPAPTALDAKFGFEISTNFLRSLLDSAGKISRRSISLEDVELVLLTLERRKEPAP